MRIARYVAKRLLFIGPQLFGIVLVSFLLVKLIPGDPAVLMLGPFATAYLKAHGRTAASLERVRDVVAPLSRHLGTEGCLGQISEIADGDAPHVPRGCVAQAWSVAEITRVLLVELR